MSNIAETIVVQKLGDYRILKWRSHQKGTTLNPSLSLFEAKLPLFCLFRSQARRLDRGDETSSMSDSQSFRADRSDSRGL